MVALAETFVDERKMGNLMKYLWMENGRTNQVKARKLWLLWDKSVNVCVVSMSDQFITVKILGGSTESLISLVYAKCNYGQWRQLWRDLEEEAHTNSPWMILGDINIIRSNEERGGAGCSSSYDSDVGI